MKPREFFKRWGEGIKNLSPRQQLQSRLVGTIGTVVGLLLAWVVMLTKGMWYFSIIMFFAIFLQVISLIGTRQQYVAMVEMEKQMESVSGMVQENKQEGGNKNGI